MRSPNKQTIMCRSAYYTAVQLSDPFHKIIMGSLQNCIRGHHWIIPGPCKIEKLLQPKHRPWKTKHSEAIVSYESSLIRIGSVLRHWKISSVYYNQENLFNEKSKKVHVKVVRDVCNLLSLVIIKRVETRAPIFPNSLTEISSCVHLVIAALINTGCLFGCLVKRLRALLVCAKLFMCPYIIVYLFFFGIYSIIRYMQ